MNQISIDLEELGIVSVCLIQIDDIGNVVLRRNYNNQPEIVSSEIENLLRILVLKEPEFLGNDQDLDFQYIKRFTFSQYYFCSRQKVKRNYLILIIGLHEYIKMDLYLRKHKALLFKLVEVVKAQNINSKYDTKEYKIDIKSFIDVEVPQYELHQFWNAIYLEKYPMRHKNTQETIILSKQQSKVMLGLAMNLTYNQILKKYAIKPKTSEFYLQLIKAKTGYNKKIELICAFMDSNPWIKTRQNNEQ